LSNWYEDTHWADRFNFTTIAAGCSTRVGLSLNLLIEAKGYSKNQNRNRKNTAHTKHHLLIETKGYRMKTEQKTIEVGPGCIELKTETCK